MCNHPSFSTKTRNTKTPFLNEKHFISISGDSIKANESVRFANHAQRVSPHSSNRRRHLAQSL